MNQGLKHVPVVGFLLSCRKNLPYPKAHTAFIQWVASKPFLCCTWELSKFDLEMPVHPELQHAICTVTFWREMAYLFLLNEKCSNVFTAC